MRKGCDGGEKNEGGKREKREKTDENSGHYDRPNADRWNAARSRQKIVRSKVRTVDQNKDY